MYIIITINYMYYIVYFYKNFNFYKSPGHIDLYITIICSHRKK